jgi:mannosidase alpha-like ER degradation enhancer 2
MFRFGYGEYMRLAFPKDDLRPISCRGRNSQGGIALTLIDSLDTLIVRSAAGSACWRTGLLLVL